LNSYDLHPAGVHAQEEPRSIRDALTELQATNFISLWEAAAASDSSIPALDSTDLAVREWLMSCFAFKRAALKVTYIASFLSMLEGPDLCPNRRGHRSKSSGKPLRRAADQSCRPHHPVLK